MCARERGAINIARLTARTTGFFALPAHCGRDVRAPSDKILGFEYKPGVPIFVALFPYRDDLIDGDVADVLFVVLQLQYMVIDFDDFATQA